MPVEKHGGEVEKPFVPPGIFLVILLVTRDQHSMSCTANRQTLMPIALVPNIVASPNELVQTKK